MSGGGRRNCYLLHHYLVQQRDVLQHGQMSVSAAPAGKVHVARKVSQDPAGDSPDKGAEQCWKAFQQSEESRLAGLCESWALGRLRYSVEPVFVR